MADRLPMDVKSYRVMKFIEVGYDDMRAMVLANTKDERGVPVYWVDVKKLVERVGLNAAYDILA